MGVASGGRERPRLVNENVRQKKNRLDYRYETADGSSSWHIELDSRSTIRMAAVFVGHNFHNFGQLFHLVIDNRQRFGGKSSRRTKSEDIYIAFVSP